MKRPNNKFRNNNHNHSQAFSLNYKFDSNSIAGKISGTALDLIKKYNELAKDAHNDSDYVTAEVFRQYAEHYRKIVTEINERKNTNNNRKNNQASEGELTTEPQSETSVKEEPVIAKKEFKVIEISEAKEQQNKDIEISKEKSIKPKRTYRKKVIAAE